MWSNNGDSIDREIEKEKFALRSRRENKNGFEGCKRCGDGGFYLQSYSKEGYCSECELACFPERFYPCIHCRTPNSLAMSCLMCKSDMNEFINTTHKCGPCHMGRDHEVLCKYLEWDKYANKFTNAGDHNSSYKHSHGWNGFFMGNNSWKKLPYLPKVLPGGICIEEPWYLPSWLTVQELYDNLPTATNII